MAPHLSVGCDAAPSGDSAPGAWSLASAAWTRGRTNLVPLALLLGIAVLPTLLTPIPAMVDYLNHLARMHLLAADAAQAPSPYYQVRWAIYPNLAMDLAVPRLARVMGVEAAARLFLLASQLLVVCGAAAIELVVKRRLAIAGPIAVLVLYSVPFAWGFVNFEFALGLALWGIAGWLALAGRAWPLRLAAHCAVVAALFVGHFFALGLYGFALGVHELWAARRRGARKTLPGTAALLAAPAVVALALMGAGGGSIGAAGNVWFLATKPLWPFALLNGYSVTLSILEASALLCLVYILAREKRLQILASGGWMAAAFAALYVALPSLLLDTAYSDIRVLVGAALIVPAFVDVTCSTGAWRNRAAILVVGCALANVGTAAAVNVSYASTYAEMIASFARLRTGARVLVGHSGSAEDAPMGHLADYPLYHAPTLAVHYAKAFVPTLFTTTGKQPLDVAPALRGLTHSCGGPVPMKVLASLATGREPPAPAPAFVRTWTRDFDYLYVLGDGTAPNLLPDRLELLEAHPRFALYRIRKPEPVAASR